MKAVVFLLLVAMVTVHGAQPRKKASNGECDLEFFKCGDLCYTNAFKCDAYPDCPDNSDEANCKDYICGDKMPTCQLDSGDFMCIDPVLKCDGYNDCKNGEDEKDCLFNGVCDLESFECDDRSGCYPKAYKCDGVPDCPDNSDEANCKDYICGDGKRTCQHDFGEEGSYMCIDPLLRCDGYNDCKNGEDEKDCQVKRDHMPTKRLVELLKALLRDE